MGVLLAFFVGWAAGAKAGAAGFRDVADAVRTVRESDEFDALVAITRSHVSSAMEQLSKLVSGESPMPESTEVLDWVQRMTSQRPT